MKKKRLKPLGDRIIVKRAEAEKTSRGTHGSPIIIPDSALEKMSEGVIIRIGQGKTQEDGYVRPLDVAVGQTVLFSKHAGTDVKVNGEELLILHEEDLFGVLEEYDDEEKEAPAADATAPS